MRYATICFVVLMVMACTKKEKPALSEPGISKHLADHRKASLDSIVYQLYFNIPESKDKPITARANILFHKNDGSDLILDFNVAVPDVKRVSVNHKDVDFQLKNEHIIIPGAYFADDNEVIIDFIAGDQSLNRYDDYLYTLFVPDRASTCFPVFDQPDLKAHFQLTLEIPKSWKAVSNMSAGKILEQQGTRIYQFKSTEKISTYLFSFAAGDFKVVEKVIDGFSYKMYHRETDSLKVKNNLDTIFAWHASAKDWLEDYTDIKYSFNKLDFVAIPSFQYGGMEHTGNIFYKASSLFLNETATLNQELGRARLIAHEVSHMWFGNLVTMKWFNDVWLKEVFANFMAAKIVNPGFSGLNHNLKFLLSHYPAAYAVDRTDGTHPISQPLNNLKNAGSLYGAIIYHKAPVAMHHLEEVMGGEAFQSGLRKYLHTYAHDNATWSDLLDILNDETEIDLGQWDKSWIEGLGMPAVGYSYSTKGGQIKDFTIKNYLPQSLTFRFWSKDSVYQYEKPPDLTGPTRDLDGWQEPHHLFINAAGMGYGVFQMGSRSVDHFMDSVQFYNDEMLRAGIWVNFYERMLHERDKPKPDALFKRIMKNLAVEKNALITEYLLNISESIFWRFLTQEQQMNVVAKYEGVLVNQLLGNNISQSLKAAFLKTFVNVAITDNGVGLLRKFWDDEVEVEGLDLSEQDYINLVQALAVREVPDADQLLEDQKNKITNPDRKKRFEFIVPALSSDEEVRASFFESLKNPENRENEEWVLEGLHYLHHPLRQSSALQFIDPSLEMLEEIKLTGDIFFPKRWLDNTLSGHSSIEADDIVRQFLYRHHDYPKDLKQKVLQSSDMLFRSVQIKGGYGEKEARKNNL